jgi:hypothetical protein
VISKSNFEKNPWSERCHKRMLDQMKTESEGPRSILVSNINTFSQKKATSPKEFIKCFFPYIL